LGPGIESRRGCHGDIRAVAVTARTRQNRPHTLNSAATASLAIAPLIYRKQPQSVLDDYEFISLFAITPNVLVVTPTLPLKTR
jgi:tripartite-type tricarboxylate transporter receptor subunit TctC